MLDPVITAKCRFCGGRNTAFLVVANGVEYHKCADCECTFQTNAELKKHNAKKNYDGAYLARYEANETTRRYRIDEAKYLIEKYGPRIRSSLEIGLGDGAFSATLASAGVNAYGVDISPQIVAHGIEKGITATVGDWESGDVCPVGRYDLVAMIHNIEHYDDPQYALSLLVGKARHGGLVYIHTPNNDNARDANWWHYHEEHTCLFGQRALAQLFDAYGVRVQEVRKLYGDDLVFIGEKL